ncbi:MAG: hypothetical protein K8I29_19465 [Alphaproteobacteria bacterium]|uniref:Uncharacterized protein n=1 Tax=Candidatus Nitrobium versatile TaxID=2884831 RepID=A0A953SFA4_9BACT|nr:hypothetical protein [Candidatus Nitrobium versatile]
MTIRRYCSVKVKNILRDTRRLKTPLVLALAWVLYWGVADTLSAAALLVGFAALSMILAFIVSKEMFSSYQWDVGARLRYAWEEQNVSLALLAASMLLARVLVYVAVVGAMAVTLLFLRGSL